MILIRNLIILTLITFGIANATELTLKSNNGIEKKFDVIAVSSENIFFKQGNKSQKISFSMLDKAFLVKYPKIQKLRESSKRLSEICKNGNSDSINYNSLGSNKQVQREGKGYAVRSSMYAIGGGSLPESNYSEQEFAKERTNTRALFGRISDFYEWGGVSVTTKIKVDTNAYGIKISPIEKEVDLLILNLPPKDYKKGETISVMISPTRYKHYFCAYREQTLKKPLKI